MRRLKTVKGLIEQNKIAPADILREYNVDRTSNVAKKLLENQVFDSTLKAEIRFLELFDVSPTQSAKRESSEAEAASRVAFDADWRGLSRKSCKIPHYSYLGIH